MAPQNIRQPYLLSDRLLAKHPAVLGKLREELDNLLQGKTPDAEDLKQLIYTRAVLNESMRFRPPVGMMIRNLSKDTEIDGYIFKAGRLAIFSIYNIHHHPEFWRQPEQFNPDRFLTTENREGAYLPFGTGERICIGNHFALLESQLLLSMIVQQYDVLLLNTDEVEIEMAVTLKPKGGIPVQLKRRKNSPQCCFQIQVQKPKQDTAKGAIRFIATR
jgi:cytochrome P450